eukprot:CAMPEP_0183536684 /NCGR_PEP_ID=MMETSP0371-20130417/28412_1 /TAXON_ID=268820 /ORGANISM="Peridinium aciculiferum, Strain PAER-2" /LENGTH=36 /DNA_ID= /DNA_START= /DNA_END= /DNA_ORIENTATION=
MAPPGDAGGVAPPKIAGDHVDSTGRPGTAGSDPARA